MLPIDPQSPTDRQRPASRSAPLGSNVLVVASVVLLGALLVAIPVAVLAVIELLPLGVLGGPVALFAALAGVAAAPVLARKAIRTVVTRRGPPVDLETPRRERRVEPAD